jgi:hypothetical protein
MLCQVIESTSMAAIEPPQISYMHHLPQEVVDSGAVSNLQVIGHILTGMPPTVLFSSNYQCSAKLYRSQLEAIMYAGEQFQKETPDKKRQGFFLGDGTGVGKGRTISGIIYDYYCTLCASSQVLKGHTKYCVGTLDLPQSAPVLPLPNIHPFCLQS